MQISSVSQADSYLSNGTQSVAQLQKLIVNLQKQVTDEDQSKTDTADQKQKKVLMLQQQIQQYQTEIQKLSKKVIEYSYNLYLIPNLKTIGIDQRISVIQNYICIEKCTYISCRN